jgi:hypothetical protein
MSIVKNVFKIVLSSFLLYLLLLNTPISIHAADFQSEYKVDYYLYLNNGKPQTKVKFRVDITSNTGQSFISRFSLAFPKYFKVSNPTALYNEPLIPDIQTDDTTTKLILNFPKAQVGKGVTNSIYIDFDQDNLFKINGNSWEVILPTLTTSQNDNYQITLHLPEGSTKKLSISKPSTGVVQGDSITWTNPQTKTIYTYFGDKEYYDAKLTYHLNNPTDKTGYSDVAFPPDTQNQKIYMNSLSEKPDDVFIDSDGNFIGRYILRPKEEKKIELDQTIELYVDPRKEVQQWNKTEFQNQKKYLLSGNKYWDVDIKNQLQTPQDIYKYINNLFTYNYNRVTQNAERLGATKALQNPDQAVCTEFTDVFIALARQKGIYSREIEGYGYSEDPQIRPLSKNSDVLHSWPEYYDIAASKWLATDPTWENTSGIDYFNSLDLNHIVFAIHGKDPIYPLPAGMYKTEKTSDEKDVYITVTSNPPKEKTSVKINSFTTPSKVFAGGSATAKLVVENTGNTFLWNVPIKTQSDDLLIHAEDLLIPVLAPYQKTEIPIIYDAPATSSNKATSLKVLIMGSSSSSQNILITPYYYDLGLKVGIVVITACFLLVVGGFFLKKIVRL